MDVDKYVSTGIVSDLVSETVRRGRRDENAIPSESSGRSYGVPVSAGLRCVESSLAENASDSIVVTIVQRPPPSGAPRDDARTRTEPPAPRSSSQIIKADTLHLHTLKGVVQKLFSEENPRYFDMEFSPQNHVLELETKATDGNAYRFSQSKLTKFTLQDLVVHFKAEVPLMLTLHFREATEENGHGDWKDALFSGGGGGTKRPNNFDDGLHASSTKKRKDIE